jgi:uncharacterized damage-inducible protein DinB
VNLKKTFLMFAQYNKSANEVIYEILDTLSNDEREKARGSYYGSLTGLFRHLMGGTFFFSKLFKGALAGKKAALIVLDALSDIKIPKDAITQEQWKALKASLETIDSTFINLISALEDSDFNLPLKIDWYGDNYPEVPLAFMINQLIAHGTHHRGQISQILDELKIDNDYSGINIAFLPKPE